MKQKLEVITSLCIYFFCSCVQNSPIITKEYISYDKWEKGEYMGLKISRIILEDSNINSEDPNFHVADLRKHKIDSNFCFLERSTLNKRGKIYFSKDDDISVWSRCNDSTKLKTIFTELQNCKWYLFEYINPYEEYYVNVTNSGETNVFSFNPLNR